MMQSPYDSALRVQQRTLDTIRLSLLAELAREQMVDAELGALDVSIAHEASIAASGWEFASHPYGQRQRAHRARLENDRAGIDTRVGRLRDATMEACGQKLAVAHAAASYTASLRQRIARTEQATADDFTGGRIAQARQRTALLGR
jgi:hypothetical protein